LAERLIDTLGLSPYTEANSGRTFMPVYRAPLDDYRFVIHELLEAEKQTDLPLYADLTRDTVDDILTNAAKFCEEVLHPLNQSGDEEGCHFENGVVRTPAGFKEAFKAYADGGWCGLGAPAEFGGTNLPNLITLAFGEMAQSANQAFTMYPGLTTAAYGALIATGAPWMKEHIVPKMVAGEWTGTMCLTEPGCGTDLRLMKTRAVEQPDGSYRMTGTKIFISGGDHDLTDNIIHMVIAKIPDENGKIYDDLSTVNFFLVPKFIVKEDGSPGPRNGVTCGGIEKKMGIKANATAVLNFDNAVAWRLGPKPKPYVPGEKRSADGMKGMFGMMNAARLGVGVQGISIGEVSYQNGLAYALTRRVGHALTGPKEPDKSADLEIVHPDVRRMLLHSKSFVEGARAVALWTAMNSSIAESNRPERDTAALLADLLTPVIKAFFTDMGFEAANMGMQCYGGHGYIRDNGVEQFVRDGRINQTYEGANGVQAMDLVGRKLGRKGGAAPMALFNLISGWISENAKDDKLTPFTKPLQRGLDTLQQATLWLAQNGIANPNHAGAGAVDYLRMMGIVVTGWMWGRMAKLSQAKLATGDGDKAFYEAKIVSARYWMERMMPECPMLFERIQAGSDTIMAFAPDAA
jgi:alkylation response protein AidB-like acyl-CoA dehydrogenase